MSTVVRGPEGQIVVAGFLDEEAGREIERLSGEVLATWCLTTAARRRHLTTRQDPL